MTESTKIPSETVRKPRRRVLPLVLFFAVFALVVGEILGSGNRTYLIESRSFGATITTKGHTNKWDLEESILCTPREFPKRDLGGDTICPESIFKIEQNVQPRTVNWPANSEIRLSLQSDDSLVIEAVSGTGDALQIGERLVVPANSWRRHGALVVNGSVVFGGDMGPNSSDYLLAGSWQVRQLSITTETLRRPNLEVVKSGSLSRGASAEIWHRDALWGTMSREAPATMFGHVTPSFDNDAPGIVMTFLSEVGYVEMRLRYYGLKQYAAIRPDIFDTIRTSPIIIAIIAILTLAASLADLVGGLGRESTVGSSRLLIFLKSLRRTR